MYLFFTVFPLKYRIRFPYRPYPEVKVEFSNLYSVFPDGSHVEFLAPPKLPLLVGRSSVFSRPSTAPPTSV